MDPFVVQSLDGEPSIALTAALDERVWSLTGYFGVLDLHVPDLANLRLEHTGDISCVGKAVKSRDVK